MFIAFAAVAFVTCAMAVIFLRSGGDFGSSWLRHKKSANTNSRHIANTAAAPSALLSPGWLYKYEFATADCSGKPYAVSSAEVANVCFLLSSNSSSSPMSYAHYCYNDSEAMVMATRYFKSVNCDPDTLHDGFVYAGYCEDQLYPDGVKEQYGCTTNATVDLGDTYYLDSTQHMDANCSGGTIRFEGYRNGACVPFNDSGIVLESDIYDYPKHIYYGQGVLNCSGHPIFTLPLPPLGECEYNMYFERYVSTALTSNVTAPDGLAPAPMPSAGAQRKTSAVCGLLVALACCASIVL